MVDIHSHILFDVDDGSKSLETSIEYLNEIKSIGMNKVVCTPHFHHKNASKLEKIKNNFIILKKEAKKLGIDLYLGTEIMYSNNMLDMLKNKEILTYNNSKYILMEFKRNENMSKDNVYDIFDRVLDAGYKVVFAHPEQYDNYRDLEFVKKLKDKGVIIQIDGTSLLMGSPFGIRSYTKKLLKNYLVDIVASDAHCTKQRNFTSLAKAYKIIKKKYGNYADIIFEENPNIIVNPK